MSGSIRIDIRVPLDRFTLDVVWESSERWMGIFGHSGAGKTTILEAVAGLRGDVTGRIEIGGRAWLDTARGVRLPPQLRGVGYLPQDLRLFPHRTVMGNLLAGGRRARRTASERLAPSRVLRMLELEQVRESAISELSGGEMRRVALGRALCSGPELMLLDEPLGGLDLPLRRRILPYLLQVQREFDIPTLCVSHDASEIRMLSGEVAVLDRGRLIARGRPEEVFTDPAVLPIAREDGFENILRGRVVERAEATATIELEPGLTVMVPGRALAQADEAVVGIRAEDLILAVDAPTGLSAQNMPGGSILEIREAAGGDPTPDRHEADERVLVVVALGRAPTRVVAAITRKALLRLDLKPGMPVHLIFKTHACRVLAAL
ncbi:MAG TPA: ATP-binding cassette domain-containing protein [Candidatus Polarisedimenticolia bacterium]